MDKTNNLVFSEELFKQHYGQVIKIIIKEMRGVDLNAANLDFNDLLQEAKIVFLYAMKRYNDTKGTKFNTFLHMVLSHRLGCFREKILKKRRKGREIRVHDLYKFEKDEECFDGAFDKISFKHCSTDQSIDHIIDLKNALSRLPKEKAFIYNQFFIEQKNITEIMRENKNIKYNDLKTILVELKDMNEALFGED